MSCERPIAEFSRDIFRQFEVGNVTKTNELKMKGNLDFEMDNTRRGHFDILNLNSDDNLGRMRNDCEDGFEDFKAYGFEAGYGKSRGRPRMEHPTKVYGEVTR